MTFDLDLSPTDLDINRGHLLTKDYLPTKFEACGAKRCWVIHCTRFERLTWPWPWPSVLTINRDHLLIKDYLPTKFEASGAKRCWVISCTRFERLTWPLTLTFDLLTWLSIRIIYSSRTIFLPSLKLLGQSVLELSVAQGLRATDIPTDRHTDRHVPRNMPLLLRRGHKNRNCRWYTPFRSD